MSFRCLTFKLAIAAIGVVIVHTVYGEGQTTSELNDYSGLTTVRRLNEEEYTRSVAHIFGGKINIPGRFSPPLRHKGLIAIGDGKVSVTASGLEQHDLRAREIAAQVLSEERRDSVMPCAPDSEDRYDANCGEKFVIKYGRLLYRRPLTDLELQETLKIARMGSEQTNSFYQGLQMGLSRLLMSPHFLFRVEKGEEDPNKANAFRLDAYSLASRVSFLLWDAPPDEQLLDAAANGELYNKQGLSAQVERLMASPHFEEGVRAYFSDMFAYEIFDGLSKDQTLYPKFTSQLAEDAKEQSLRTIVNLLVHDQGDYRDLFTTRNTFLNRRLASVYRVPIMGPSADGWIPYTFQPGSNRAGILTLAGFLMLDATHEGETSPTVRGKQIRELLMCQEIPAPPADVDFSQFNNPDPSLVTTRDRLKAHRENPVCAGCHALMDPIGLSMENYNIIGEYRTRQNGAPIDASGSLDGKSFANLVEMQQVLYESATATSCAAQRVYEYSVGRELSNEERSGLAVINREFEKNQYKFTSLMRIVATSPLLRSVSAEKAYTDVVQN